MTIKYEALVGHLFVVGGRPLSTPPPGAKVQLPPRRVHRSREQDTLFVLATPAGQSQTRANFYEDLAALACDAYFKSRLGVTGALRDAVNALNSHIQKNNQQQASDWRAGVVLLVKRAEEVYLARAGTTICVAQRREGFEAFPNDPDMLNMLPLGSRSEPSIEFTFYSLSPQDIFIIGDAGIATLSDDSLKRALKTGNIESALEVLETAVESQAFASVIQFIDADAPDSTAAPTLEAPTSQESLDETIPSLDEDQTRPSTLAFSEERQASENTEASPTRQSPKMENSSEDDTQVLAKTAQIDMDEVDYPPDTPIHDDTLEGDSDTTRAAPHQQSRRRRRNKSQVAPDAPQTNSETEQRLPIDQKGSTPDVDTGEAQGKTEKKRKRQSLPRLLLIGILVLVSGVLRAISNAINAILDRLLPEPEEGTRASTLVPMNLVALVAVIVPAVVAVVVVGVAISNRDSTEFEELRSFALQAESEALLLEEEANATPRDKRNAWIEVRTWAQRALNEYGESAEMRRVLLDAQNNINRYDRIIPTEVNLLRTFQENAYLVGPILSASGQDIFTLDRNRSQIYRDSLDGAGINIVNSEEVPVVERGREINTYLVSNLVDIEWITGPGAGQDNALIALDDNGLLISYNATFGLSAIQMDIPPEWSRPQAIALWDVNLYVLDAGANQIWRFRPENGFFQNPPEEYFTGNNRPDLGAAVDFGIEEGGDIFILFNDGTISPYRGGDPIAFELNEASAPVDGINNGTALYVNNARGDYALYVADASNATVYKISIGGTVRGGYRPLNILSETVNFNDVSGVYDDPMRGNVYILSGNALYRANRIVD